MNSTWVKPASAPSRSALASSRGGNVDAGHFPRVADVRAGDESVHPGAGAEVDDRLARTELGEVEEVADPCERLDRRGGNLVEIRRWVAEPLGELTPHLEVEGAVRVFGHLAVHLLDLHLQLVGIERCGRVVVVHRVPRRSVFSS